MLKFNVYNFTTRQEVIFNVENPFTGNTGNAFDDFLKHYSPDLITFPSIAKRKLPEQNQRVCRFCHKDNQETSFKNDAHVIPHLLGNRYLIHENECDACNDMYKVYEDCLAKHLGMIRTADAIRGKSKVPTFKSTDGKLTMKLAKSENGVHYIDIIDQNYFATEPNKPILIKGTKQSYTPLHVMKSLFKIGYCLLQPEELPDYEPTLKIINSNEFDNKIFNFCQVARFTIPGRLETPYVITYKKNKEFANMNLPSKVITLHFGRYIYEYFLLNSKDTFLFKAGESCTFLQIPPFFHGDQQELKFERLNLSSPFKKEREEQTFTLTFD